MPEPASPLPPIRAVKSDRLSRVTAARLLLIPSADSPPRHPRGLSSVQRGLCVSERSASWAPRLGALDAPANGGRGCGACAEGTAECGGAGRVARGSAGCCSPPPSYREHARVGRWEAAPSPGSILEQAAHPASFSLHFVIPLWNKAFGDISKHPCHWCSWHKVPDGT